MKTMKILWIWLALCLGVSLSAAAQDRGTADQAKAMAEKAVAHIKAVGAEKAYEEFSARDGKWQDRDLYVFAIRFDGFFLAHGANKGLVGKNLIELKDPKGTFYIKEFIEVAKNRGSGWVDYMFADPQTKKTLPKSSYIIRVPGSDAFVGVGIYK